MTTEGEGAEPQPTEAQLQRVDAVLVAFCEAHRLTANDLWKLKHRVRRALEGGDRG